MFYSIRRSRKYDVQIKQNIKNHASIINNIIFIKVYTHVLEVYYTNTISVEYILIA